MSWLRIPSRLIAPVVDFALPPRCPGCGAIIPTDGAFCYTCWSSLDLLGDPCCDRCALPFETVIDAGTTCAGCLADPPAFDRLRAGVAYGELARGLALKLKYGRRPGMAKVMARLMARHLAKGEEQRLICPVPLHRWRIWQRGYNQAALIGSALARTSGDAFRPDLLQRIRATPPLRNMGPSERRRTVRGAFRIHPRHKALVAGRTIVLIDDVFTSGATASACAQVLRRAGAARVEVLCWARVVRSSAGDH